MQTPDLREWLLTNGLGSFASGTICDARTRTYHGWLVAALHPPEQRTLLLSHLEASLEIAGQVFALGTNFWMGEKIDPWATSYCSLLSEIQYPPGLGERQSAVKAAVNNAGGEEWYVALGAWAREEVREMGEVGNPKFLSAF